jgi:hypothetical protein
MVTLFFIALVLSDGRMRKHAKNGRAHVAKTFHSNKKLAVSHRKTGACTHDVPNA